MTIDEQRIKQANAFLGCELEWTPTPRKGHTNKILYATRGDEKLVLRLNADPQRAFGVDRHLEACVLRVIADYSWSPDVLHSAPDEGWMLMRDHSVSVGDLDASVVTSYRQFYAPQFYQFLADMQSLTTEEIPRFDYKALVEKYRISFASEHGEKQAMLERLRGLFNGLPQHYQCLTHHDLHAGNACLDQGRFIIIDWEYAGRGQPWLDLARLHQNRLLEMHRLLELPCSRELSEREVRWALRDAASINELLEQLWFAVRRQKLSTEAGSREARV